MDTKMTEFILAVCDVFAVKRDSSRFEHVKEIVKKAIVDEIIDWQAFFECGELHRYLPAAYVNLKNYLNLFDEIKDDNVKNKLHSYYIRTVQNNNSYYQELVALYSSFEKEKLKVLLIKGEVLAFKYYPDISIRYFDDCDLLLDKEEIKKSEHILKQYNYEQGYGEDGIIKKPSKKEIWFSWLYMKHIIAYVKYNNEKLYVIEPHYLLWWHNPDGSPAFNMSMQSIIDRAEKINLFDQEAWKMNNNDMLIYLAIDLYEDAYRVEKIMQKIDLQLLKFLDIYSVVMDGVDWTDVVSNVLKYSMNIPVWFALEGLNKLYEIIPEWVLEEIKPGNTNYINQFGFIEELVSEEYGEYDKSLYERIFDTKYRQDNLEKQIDKFKQTSFQYLKENNKF